MTLTPMDELYSAWTDVRWAYADLIKVDLTFLDITKAKKEMDQAMERLDNAISNIQRQS